VVQGIVLTVIGLIPNIEMHPLIAAVAVSAIFTDAGNGANFAVVPHVHPSNNGIVAGLTGASGNLGGIVFALIFRFNGVNYHKSYWIIGVISMGLSLFVSWIRIPKVRLFRVDLLIRIIAPWRNRLAWKTASWTSIVYMAVVENF
jgi:MFS transporter, NNP family, nitrate/nitrite transporter